MMPTTTKEALPPLPETRYNACGDGSEPLYTPEMMRAYGLACIAAQADAVPVEWKAQVYEWMCEYDVELKDSARLALIAIEHPTPPATKEVASSDARLAVDSAALQPLTNWRMIAEGHAMESGMLQETLDNFLVEFEKLQVFSGGYYVRRDAVRALFEQHCSFIAKPQANSPATKEAASQAPGLTDADRDDIVAFLRCYAKDLEAYEGTLPQRVAVVGWANIIAELNKGKTA